MGHVSTAEALSRWTGGIDLYRASAFTTQQTWLWCTAADVQIARNIVRGEADHSRSRQEAYFSYMREHDRYAIPVSDGTEPSGWAAGMRRYVDGRYRLVASGSFDAALRSAVTNLRRTNLPVGLLVAHGDHAWILTGFTATADPAETSRFTVTSVRVTGPLWGLQDRSYGYDMRPDTRLTPSQLATFFGSWHYAPVRMAWEGRWVSIQAVSSGTARRARPTPAAASSPRGAAATAARAASAAPLPLVGRSNRVSGSPATVAATPGSIAAPATVDPARFAPAATGTAPSERAAADADAAPEALFAPGSLQLAFAITAVVGLVVVAGRAFRRGRRPR